MQTGCQAVKAHLIIMCGPHTKFWPPLPWMIFECLRCLYRGTAVVTVHWVVHLVKVEMTTANGRISSRDLTQCSQVPYSLTTPNCAPYVLWPAYGP